jgi:PAS domain S-box-containing protein
MPTPWDPAVNPSDLPQLGQALFEEAGDALLLIDPTENRVLDANRMAERLTGYRRSELRGQPFWQLIDCPEPESEPMEQALQQTITFHARDGYRLRCKAAPGWVPVNLTVARLHVTPRPLALVTARDLRKQLESYRKLQRAEAELQRVLVSVPDALWSSRRDDRGGWAPNYTSPVAARITGWPEEYLRARPENWWQIIHPEDRGHARTEYQRCYRGEVDKADIEFRVVSPEGEVRWVRDRVRVSRNGQGQAARLDGVLTDITERKQEAEALRLSEERFRSLFERHASVMLLIDPVTDAIIDANGAAEGFYGYTREQLRMMAITDLNQLSPQRTHEEMNRALRGENGHFVFPHRLANGQIRSVEVHSSPIAYDGKQLLFSIIHDVTARQQLEARLRQVQKMEAVGRLAGGIAHDFNNLLTAVNGYSSLILSQLDRYSPMREYVEEIHRSGERAAALTRQLLAFSRQSMLQPTVLDLNQVIRGLDKLLGQLVGTDIRLRTALATDLWSIKVDLSQIEQVLVNLATNARDAMPDGGELTVATGNCELTGTEGPPRPGLRPGRYVSLTVADTGIGMDEPTLARIFEPFFTTKEVGKGTGLGLATAYGVIKQSQGYIYATSTPGRGSTFTVYLPPCDDDRPADEPMQRHATPAPALPRGHETILVAEDEDGVRALVTQILRQCGYRVLVAGNGPQALALNAAESGAIDLVLSDVVMPEMSGPALVEELVTTRPGLKSLFVSGYTDVKLPFDPDDRTRLLQKPFSPAELARTVREVLDGVRGG